MIRAMTHKSLIVLVALAALAVLGCTGSALDRGQRIETVLDAAKVACKVYAYAPADQRTPEADRLCPYLTFDPTPKSSDAGAAGSGGRGPSQ